MNLLDLGGLIKIFEKKFIEFAVFLGFLIGNKKHPISQPVLIFLKATLNNQLILTLIFNKTQ